MDSCLFFRCVCISWVNFTWNHVPRIQFGAKFDLVALLMIVNDKWGTYGKQPLKIFQIAHTLTKCNWLLLALVVWWLQLSSVMYLYCLQSLSLEQTTTLTLPTRNSTWKVALFHMLVAHFRIQTHTHKRHLWFWLIIITILLCCITLLWYSIQFIIIVFYYNLQQQQ